MAAVGRGRGRGRGLLARETPSESSPRPSGLASGDAKFNQNGDASDVAKSTQTRKESDSISEITDVLDNLKLDVSEQDLKNLQQLAESAIKDDSDIKKVSKLIYDKCIGDREFAKTGAYICEKITGIENKGNKFRSSLLAMVQVDFKSKEELRSSSPSKFLNVFSFMCQIFSIMRTANGEVFKALVTPLYEYITLIVDSEKCTSDEYECLNIQLQAVGKDLELNDKEKMEKLMENIRSKIIRNGSTAQARCTMLELMECYCRGWKDLNNDVTRFYLDIMMDIITD